MLCRDINVLCVRHKMLYGLPVVRVKDKHLHDQYHGLPVSDNIPYNIKHIQYIVIRREEKLDFRDSIKDVNIVDKGPDVLNLGTA